MDYEYIRDSEGRFTGEGIRSADSAHAGHIPVIPPMPMFPSRAEDNRSMEMFHAFQVAHRSSPLMFAGLERDFREMWKNNHMHAVDVADAQAEKLGDDWNESIIMLAGFPYGKMLGTVYSGEIKNVNDFYVVSVSDNEHPHSPPAPCFIAKFDDFEEAWNFAKYAVSRNPGK